MFCLSVFVCLVCACMGHACMIFQFKFWLFFSNFRSQRSNSEKYVSNGKDMDRRTDGQNDWPTSTRQYSLTRRSTYRHTNKPTDNRTDRQTYRPLDTHRDFRFIYTNKQTDKFYRCYKQRNITHWQQTCGCGVGCYVCRSCVALIMMYSYKCPVSTAL